MRSPAGIARGGKAVYGAAVGILILEARFPRIPGDVGNAVTWPFPVLYKVVRGASPERVVRRRAEGLLEAFVEGARELVAQGADGIVTNCGFLSLIQDELAAACGVPVAASSLMQAPLIERLLPPAPRPLLDFAESARSVAGREQALLRAAEVVDSPMVPESERAWHRGRIAWLNGDAAAAVEFLKQSVDADGLDAWRRLDYARALHVQGDRVAALEQVDAARRLAPQDRRIQSRATELDDTIHAPRR